MLASFLSLKRDHVITSSVTEFLTLSEKDMLAEVVVVTTIIY